MNQRRRQPIHRDSTFRSAGEHAGVGLQFAGAIVLFLFIGMWLDERLGTDPWLLITGAFIGGVAGFYSLYHQLVVRPRQEEAERRSETEEKGK